MGKDPRWWNKTPIHPTIANYYGYFRQHILREIDYGKQLNAKYIVIHCGSKGGRKNQKREIPTDKFIKRLSQLCDESPVEILIENSASKKCFGSTIDELLQYIENIPNISICYDTMHHYGAGNDIDKIPTILSHDRIKCIHVNDIPLKVTYGSGEDEHESLTNGIIATYDKGFKFEQLKSIKKIKILETPRKELWSDELKLINNIMTNVIKVHSVPTQINGRNVEAIVDSGAEWTLMSEKALARIDLTGKIPTTDPIPGFRLKSANAEMPIKKWILATVRIGPKGEYVNQHKIPIVSQGREVLIGLDILNNQFDIFLTTTDKFMRTKDGKKISLHQRKDILLSEILCQHISKDDVLYQVWKSGKDGENWLLTEIQNTGRLINNLKDEHNKLMTERHNIKGYKNSPFTLLTGGKTLKQEIDKKLELINEDIIDLEKYDIMLQNILKKVQDQRIREERIQSQDQIEIIKQFMEEQKRKADLKKAQMANEWQERVKINEQTQPMIQTYPAKQQMNNWYYGNFDGRNPRNQYEETLLQMQRSRPIRRRSQSRSRSRSQIRRSRSRPIRRQSQSRSKRPPTPRPQYRYRSRSRSKGERRSRSRRNIHAITRSQSRNMRQRIQQSAGTRVRPSMIPQITPTIRQITPRSSTTAGTGTPSIYSGPHTNSIRNSIPSSRMYTPTSSFNSLGPSQRSQSGSLIPSLPSSRQQTPISPQSSRNSSTQPSTRSSQGPQIVPMWKANAAMVINGDINGRRLQVIFSTIHKSDWMTVTTANTCGLLGRRMQNDQYLENTYMDHRYSQMTRNPINILIGDDPHGNNLFITTEDQVFIVFDSNFYHRSQSMTDPRNRLFILIGTNTIERNGLIIRPSEGKILYPNPNYIPPTEKKYYTIRTMKYPDLADQRNREFNIGNINVKNILASHRKLIKYQK